ncbi:hypothetical protein BC834DRAFT_907473 [Gloeopeniophorella convolvens]|nr:hypothetical protein BC834DRAFT_907473 [Gloeopeniophorella convolvens]
MPASLIRLQLRIIPIKDPPSVRPHSANSIVEPRTLHTVEKARPDEGLRPSAALGQAGFAGKARAPLVS